MREDSGPTREETSGHGAEPEIRTTSPATDAGDVLRSSVRATEANTDGAPGPSRGRRRRAARIAWATFSFFVVESVVLGLSSLPAAAFWSWHFRWDISTEWLRVVVLSMGFIPSYLIFSFTLMVLSAFASRLVGWRTPADAEMRIADQEWPLLRWARYQAASHVVRVFAGTVYRSTPVWSFFLKLNGARIGRRVFVNSLKVGDHNLLEFGDGVVIGSDVHLSGHTVERGVVRTAPVRLAANVTVGIGSVVGIGVRVGAGTQVAALSVVPKFHELDAGAVYAGVPARRIDESPGRSPPGTP